MLMIYYVVVGGVLGFLLGNTGGILLGIMIGILFEISIKLNEIVRLLRSKEKNGNV